MRGKEEIRADISRSQMHSKWPGEFIGNEEQETHWVIRPDDRLAREGL